MQSIARTAATLFFFGLAVLPAQAQFSGDQYRKQGDAMYNAHRYRESVAAFSVAIDMDSRDWLAFYGRAMALSHLDIEKALADCSRSAALNPRDGRAHLLRAKLWMAQGQLDQAIDGLNEAIRLRPDSAHAYNARGVAWHKKGEFGRAIDDFNQAIRISPRYAQAYNDRGNTWQSKGEYERAVQDYQEAMRVEPEYASPFSNCALLLATCPDAKFRDGLKAFQYASRAYQLNGGRSWTNLENLAAAYAECGDFASAVEWAERAIALAEQSGARPNEVLEAKAHLELYKARQPYRQSAAKK